jgi:hypothetical protein
MAYLMLYGSGWTQRWRIPDGTEDQVRSQISQIGTHGAGRLSVVDPGSDAAVTLMIAWDRVASAVVIGEAEGPATTQSGQYA